MTATSGGHPRFAVRFDDLLFGEDLRHATPSGREVATRARRRFEDHGAELSELRRCDPDARDGTSLANCVKAYLPTADGRWRMVFEALRDPASGTLVLAYLAFGVAHPEHPWQRSVYEVAHRRLHAD